MKQSQGDGFELDRHFTVGDTPSLNSEMGSGVCDQSTSYPLLMILHF